MSLFTFKGEWYSETDDKKGKISVELPYEYTPNFETVIMLTDLTERHSSYYDVQGSYTDNSNGLECYYLYPVDIYRSNLFTTTLIKDIDSGTVSGVFLQRFDWGKLTLECVETCIGCLGDQPNQLAHMDYGGCLYEED